MLKKISYFVSKTLGEIPHLRELVCFISWARKKYPAHGFVVHIALTGFRKRLCVGVIQNNAVSPEFIFCNTGKHLPIIENIKIPASNWKRVFTSFHIEIWEKITTNNTEKLRFGLTKSDEMLAFTIVRGSAQKLFKKEITTIVDGCEYPTVFKEPVTVCVALWIRGEVRGSVIIHKETFHEALIEAGRKVCIDGRFKPVSQKEFNESRIEITLISDLRIPLSKKDYLSDTINPWVGYVIEHGEKRGWYMPEMFNCIHAQSLKKFTHDLAFNKADLTSQEVQYATVSTFLVHDFIESADHTSCFEVDASVPKRHNDKQFLKTSLIQTGLHLYTQLAHNQEPDGNIPPVLNPLSGIQKQVDWAQLGCTTWALAMFGESIRDEKILYTAHKSFQYLHSNIFREGLLNARALVATLPYFIRASKILGEEKMVHAGIERLHHESKEINFYTPILYANISSVFAKEGAYFPNSIRQAIHFATITHADFLKKKNAGEKISLALYPELVSAFLALYDATKDTTLLNKATDLLDWTNSFQLNNGAFPQANLGFPNSYTRGTGKIFEVLCLQYPLYKKETRGAFGWLKHMQYTPESLYFVNPELHRLVSGGLRHDYLNQELWIDGSAHMLIGISRIIKKNDIL